MYRLPGKGRGRAVTDCDISGVLCPLCSLGKSQPTPGDWINGGRRVPGQGQDSLVGMKDSVATSVCDPSPDSAGALVCCWRDRILEA